jgi:hypothetical protein
VIDHLVEVHEEEHVRGTAYKCGVLANETVVWRMAVVIAGMGNPAAALEVESHCSFRPEIVLLVGRRRLKDVGLGDVVAEVR